MKKSNREILCKVLPNLPSPYNKLSIKKYAGGYRNQHFILSSQNQIRYFVSCYDISLKDRIERVESVKDLFRAGGVPIIKPLTLNKVSLLEYDDKMFKFFPFVDSLPVSRHNIPTIALKNMGLLLANMHNVGVRHGNYSAPLSNFPNIESFSKGKDSIINCGPRANPKTRKYKELLLFSISLKEDVLKSLYPRGSRPMILNALIHGDYHEKNLLFDTNLNITAVVDWEKFEISNPLYELVRTIDYVCFTEGYSDNDYTKAIILLKAYRQKNVITKGQFAEAYNFYLYTKCCNLWRENQIAINKRNENIHQTVEFIEKDLETIYFLQKNLNEHINKLCRDL